MTLTEFLLARVSEDEDEARHAHDHSAGTPFANDDYGRLLVQPARVLAECDAKRRILVAVCDPKIERRPTTTPGRYDRVTALVPDLEGPAATVVALLALPYADHPDYKPEWRP